MLPYMYDTTWTRCHFKVQDMHQLCQTTLEKVEKLFCVCVICDCLAFFSTASISAILTLQHLDLASVLLFTPVPRKTLVGWASACGKRNPTSALLHHHCWVVSNKPGPPLVCTNAKYFYPFFCSHKGFGFNLCSNPQRLLGDLVAFWERVKAVNQHLPPALQIFCLVSWRNWTFITTLPVRCSSLN